MTVLVNAITVRADLRRVSMTMSVAESHDGRSRRENPKSHALERALAAKSLHRELPFRPA
jgi:hypothetical protein